MITEDKNPQQDDQATEEDAETLKARELILKEIEQAGEERVKAMDERMNRFADIDKRLAELMAGIDSQTEEIPEGQEEED